MLEGSSSVPTLCPAGVPLSGVEDHSLPRPVPWTSAGHRDSPIPEVCRWSPWSATPWSAWPSPLLPSLPVLGSGKDLLSGLLPVPEALLGPKFYFWHTGLWQEKAHLPLGPES